MNEQRYNLIVKDALSDMESWNREVKDEKYMLRDTDSDPYKEIKIYRYLNENEAIRRPKK